MSNPWREQNIYSLIGRPQYQSKLDGINELLKINADNHNYCFTDCRTIEICHLGSDQFHLNKDGISILANKILDQVNMINNLENFC